MQPARLKLSSTREEAASGHLPFNSTLQVPGIRYLVPLTEQMGKLAGALVLGFGNHGKRPSWLVPPRPLPLYSSASPRPPGHSQHNPWMGIKKCSIPPHSPVSPRQFTVTAPPPPEPTHHGRPWSSLPEGWGLRPHRGKPRPCTPLSTWSPPGGSRGNLGLGGAGWPRTRVCQQFMAVHLRP